MDLLEIEFIRNKLIRKLKVLNLHHVPSSKHLWVTLVETS